VDHQPGSRQVEADIQYPTDAGLAWQGARAARSRSSSGYLPGRVMAPTSHESEPPGIPERFRQVPAILQREGHLWPLCRPPQQLQVAVAGRLDGPLTQPATDLGDRHHRAGALVRVGPMTIAALAVLG
jgi:hypothetical protein